jgi:hypothetical protein
VKKRIDFNGNVTVKSLKGLHVNKLNHSIYTFKYYFGCAGESMYFGNWMKQVIVELNYLC